MAEKKTIKIQTEAEETKIKKNQEETVDGDQQNLEGEPDNTDQAEDNSPAQDLEAKLKSKEKEAQENYDRLLRVSAEFENFKKRSAREMDDFRKFANQSLIKRYQSAFQTHGNDASNNKNSQLSTCILR